MKEKTFNEKNTFIQRWIYICFVIMIMLSCFNTHAPKATTPLNKIRTHIHTHNHTNLTAQQVFIFLLSSFLDEFCVLCLVVVVCEILVFNSFNRKTIRNFANFNANKV